MINSDSSGKSSNSNRKSLVERLAALRIQSPSPKSSKNMENSSSRAPESPRYIPRSSLPATKSKFYNYNQSNQSDKSRDKLASSSSSLSSSSPSSPSIGRRRNLSSMSSSTPRSNPSTSSPIGISSPKYFPKQKAFDLIEKIIPINFEDSSSFNRNHNNVTDVVTSFIDSFTSVNSYLSRFSNSVDAKLQLQAMNNSFASLQLDLKATISKISELQTDLNEKSFQIESLNQAIETLQTEISNSSESAKSEIVPSERTSDLEAQLEIALNQIKEIKAAYEKEKENLEFLQNYMEEVVILKDESEQKVLKLEKVLESAGQEALRTENEKLKETISLLEMERKSNQNACQKALQVLDAANKNAEPANSEDMEALRQELKQKQAEIEKLRGREKHFKESNEIFQQKLMILTEENRKLRGHRPINHY